MTEDEKKCYEINQEQFNKYAHKMHCFNNMGDEISLPETKKGCYKIEYMFFDSVDAAKEFYYKYRNTMILPWKNEQEVISLSSNMIFYFELGEWNSFYIDDILAKVIRKKKF